MRDLDSAEIDAIASGTDGVAARDLIFVVAKDRDTGDPEEIGFWTGAGDATIDVKDGVTGETESRVFYGSGQLLGIGSIPLTSDIAIRSVDIDLSQIADEVQDLVREYDVRGAPIQIYRGYLDLDTHEFVAPPKARFVGYVDGAPIETPAEGGSGACTLRCVSTTRELTRTNPEVRSHESQLARAAGDAFYRDTAVVGDWDMFWGSKGGPLTQTNQKRR